MKKKFILIPITLIALSPAISLVGCGDPDTPEPPEPTPTPPTPYDIYSLNEMEVISKLAIRVYTENLFLKGGQIYQFVINYSNIEQDFWTSGTKFHLFDEGGDVSFSVLYIDIDGVKFLDKYDKSKPSYEYDGKAIKLYGFKKNIKDDSLLNIYISINTTKNNVSAEYNMPKK